MQLGIHVSTHSAFLGTVHCIDINHLGSIFLSCFRVPENLGGLHCHMFHVPEPKWLSFAILIHYIIKGTNLQPLGNASI